MNDAKVLPGIFEAQKALLAGKGLVPTAELEFSIVPAMADVELRGMLLDADKLEELRLSLQGRIADLETRLREHARINFSSPKQVLDVLKELGLSVESTAEKVLQGIDHPFAEILLEHCSASKLLSSFADKLPKHVNPVTGRIHPDFLQLGTDTGRISCQRPNLQQIPKDQVWRDLFVAPQGFKLIKADYSQIELRILAEFSKDPKFVEAYKSKKDLHQRTADLIGITRDAAKVKLVTDRDTGRPRGFGFVEMGSSDDADSAIRALNGYEFGGRALTVNEARVRTGGGGGGGGFGGGRGRSRRF